MSKGCAVLESALAEIRSRAVVGPPKFIRHSFQPGSEVRTADETSPLVLLKLRPAGILSVIRDVSAGGSFRSNSVLAASFRPRRLHSPTSRPDLRNSI